MERLNSRERILAALRCEIPDQVPFLESVVDPLVALPLLGQPAPAGSVAGELGTAPDPVLRGCLLESPYFEPLDLVENLSLDGFGMYLFAKSERIDLEVDGHMMAAGGRIKTRADLKRIDLPDPDDPGLYEPYRQFLERYRPTGKALFCFGNLGSDPVILGMGFEHFSTCLYDDPGLVVDLFELYTSWLARVTRHLSELDFDFLWFGDDLAFKTSPYVSPKLFRSLILPYFRRVVDQVDKPWIFHSDGNLMPILDDLLSLGMSGLHPIEPDAMDLELLKRRYAGQLCLVGGIDLDTLCRGTPGEVDRLVQAVMGTAAPGGGYIAGSSNSIPFYARPENVRAMTLAIKKYGSY